MFWHSDSFARLKHYLYLTILALALAADALTMLFNEVAGVATPFSRLLGLICAVFFVSALFARRQWRDAFVVVGAYLLVLVLALGWLKALYEPLPGGLAQAALLSFSLWLPAIYVVFFLSYPPGKALGHALAVLIIFVGVALPHALTTLSGGGLFDGLRFPTTLSLAHLTLIALLWSALRSNRSQQTGDEHLSTLAYTDPLTGIANRRALSIEAVRALHLSQREGWSLALLYLDLDNFKSVNDRFGHKAGDEVLQQVSTRLKSCLRGADLLSRIGGDEFVLLLQDADVGEAVKICSRIILELESPFTFGGHSVQLKASIGGAIFPKDGTDLESLLERADKSMYGAKAKNTGFAFYSDVTSAKGGVSA